jgi:hypothetical protein
MARKKVVKEEVKAEPTLTHSLFASKKDRGVTAMTQEASMMADATAKQRKPEPSSRYKDCIHKIRED